MNNELDKSNWLNFVPVSPNIKYIYTYTPATERMQLSCGENQLIPCKLLKAELSLSLPIPFFASFSIMICVLMNCAKWTGCLHI